MPLQRIPSFSDVANPILLSSLLEFLFIIRNFDDASKYIVENPFMFFTKSESVSRINVPSSDIPKPTAFCYNEYTSMN